MKSNIKQRLIKMSKKNGFLRPRDLESAGIPRIYLSRLVDEGVMQRLSRGLYIHSDMEPTGNFTVSQVAKRFPESVICLLSALQFHEITTQLPFEVWIAIGIKSRKPNAPELPIRTVRFSGDALTKGIELHTIDSVPVKVYNVAKTVADCFKYRNKIGLDVALEALKECRREKRCSIDDLWKYAKICRVGNVMRPYMETIR